MKSDKSSLFAFGFGIFTVTALVFFLMSIYMGGSPLYSYRSKLNSGSLFPEGWAFFTRDAREPRIFLLGIQNGRAHNINLRNFSSAYCFGISRANRIINVEIGTIIQSVDKSKLQMHEFEAVNGLDSIQNVNPAAVAFSNVKVDPSAVPDLKGKYIIAFQVMLPWSMISRKPDYPSRFVYYGVNIVS